MNNGQLRFRRSPRVAKASRLDQNQSRWKQWTASLRPPPWVAHASTPGPKYFCRSSSILAAIFNSIGPSWVLEIVVSQPIQTRFESQAHWYSLISQKMVNEHPTWILAANSYPSCRTNPAGPELGTAQPQLVNRIIRMSKNIRFEKVWCSYDHMSLSRDRLSYYFSMKPQRWLPQNFHLAVA